MPPLNDVAPEDAGGDALENARRRDAAERPEEDGVGDVERSDDDATGDEFSHVGECSDRCSSCGCEASRQDLTVEPRSRGDRRRAGRGEPGRSALRDSAVESLLGRRRRRHPLLRRLFE